MADVISSIAQLLWPLIALAGILVFRRAIGRVLRTAERRELEFEVGGQRLTMHELNDQQNDMIQDLQRQLSLLSQQLEQRQDQLSVPAGAMPPVDSGPEPVLPDLTEADVLLSQVQAPTGSEPFAVLWVAERPEQNALLVKPLRDNGVRVTMATTTGAALAEVQQRPYRLIVSDMSRPEDGITQPDAGVILVRELRDLGVDTPVVLFSGQRGHTLYGTQALQAGAFACTTSAYEMFTHFQNFRLL